MSSHNVNTENLPKINVDEKNIAGSSCVWIEPMRPIPSGFYKEWSKIELGILDFIIATGKTTRMLRYMEYVNESKKVGIPDRSFHAFEWKVRRLQGSKNDFRYDQVGIFLKVQF